MYIGSWRFWNGKPRSNKNYFILLSTTSHSNDQKYPKTTKIILCAPPSSPSKLGQNIPRIFLSGHIPLRFTPLALVVAPRSKRMPVVGVDHIACSCKRIVAQQFGSQIMALPVVAYSRGAPLCRLQEIVEVVLENSLVTSPLSCCVTTIHAASLGGHRGVGQIGAAAPAAAAGEIIHSSCFLLHHSSWRVASESRFSARRTRRRTSRCFSAHEFVEGDDDSSVEAVALVGSRSSTVSTVIFSIPLLVVLVWVFFSFSVCTMVWLRVGADTGAGRERASRRTTIGS